VAAHEADADLEVLGRGVLTEPPTGYRTPSPNAPYGVVEEKSKYSKTSVFDRLDNPEAKK
jgi:hypothetical protein